ncbi:hypothetical protein GCM10017691_04380 [Pseudonocardia petroleophila]|uniref:Elp3/MiaA/NifB-like radical SAM core domain-containing protein n=1 Tax=Pseudonocardia petroleophila TaxID=37331 RepID=A0A7G7MKK6_9PSEU|nr:hypothetical protein [Pseudonocardia petroleophila]QNG53317.1 hypothetical protein H6H00_04800 [Pseudonocardia petroleophila]
MKPGHTHAGVALYIRSHDYNEMLGAMSAKLIRDSPKTLRPYTVREAVDKGCRLVEVWFKTAGCRYFLQGGCTMCNYGRHHKVGTDEMVQSVASALGEAGLQAGDKLLINPSGSLLDEGEVPAHALDQILAMARELPLAGFETEAQAQYVTDEVLSRFRELMPDIPLKVVCGVESAHPWVRRNVFNKDLPTSTLLNAFASATRYDIALSTNLILGAPFLSERQSISDCVRSIRWLLEIGIRDCYIFPTSIKVGTLTHWLWQNDRFRPPSLWSLISVLEQLNEDELSCVSVAWHKPYYFNQATSIRKSSRIPFTCPQCYRQVVGLLDEFVATRSRSVVNTLSQTSCACRTESVRRPNNQTEVSIQQAVRESIWHTALEILGETVAVKLLPDLERSLTTRPGEECLDHHFGQNSGATGGENP